MTTPISTPASTDSDDYARHPNWPNAGRDRIDVDVVVEVGVDVDVVVDVGGDGWFRITHYPCAD